MSVPTEGLGHLFLKLRLDFVDILSGGQAGPIADAEDVSVDRKGFLAESCIQDNIGGLAADARERL